MAWGKRVSEVFKARVRYIEDVLGVNANFLMACMAFESARTFSPSIHNPHSSATGLIQEMEATAEEEGTTTAKLAVMTAEDQLNFVYKYFRPYAGKLKTLADTYMAILFPRAIGQPDDYKIFLPGTSQYVANAGLDTNSDHIVTKAEAAARVVASLHEGLQEGNYG